MHAWVCVGWREVSVGVSCVCVLANVCVCICHSRDRKKIFLVSKDKIKSWVLSIYIRICVISLVGPSAFARKRAGRPSCKSKTWSLESSLNFQLNSFIMAMLIGIIDLPLYIISVTVTLAKGNKVSVKQNMLTPCSPTHVSSDKTRCVTFSMSAFLTCHQCYCAGSSLAWGLTLRAVVCGIFWSSSPGVFSGYSGFLPSFIGLMVQPIKWSSNKCDFNSVKLDSWAVSSYQVARNMTLAGDKRSMCCTWFARDCARVTWAYVLETVRGVVRRL